MKGKILPICPVCDQELASDASIKNYCKLCGMGMTNSDRRLCLGCEQRFKKMLSVRTWKN